MTKPTSVLRRGERGITSIFAVMFAATLLTIIVISFAVIMIREQARSNDDELSQSAYDAAMAGVEDAKRMVALSFSDNNVATALNTYSEDCSVIAKAGAASPSAPKIGIDGQETLVTSTTSGSAGSELLQAYTCVNISLDSPDVILSDGEQLKSRVVPLRGVDDFDTVTIEWHMTTGNPISTPCGVASSVDSKLLCSQSDWSDDAASDQPAIIRAQFITPNPSGFDLASLDQSDAGNTVFLYPNAYDTVVDTTVLALEDAPRFVDGNGNTDTSINEVKTVRCKADGLGYHCKASIQLPAIVPRNSNLALLRLSTIYKQGTTDVRITLQGDGGSQVDFSRVQPIVDSTGRANDLFRRVQARLSLVADVEYPEFALDVSGALCKDFYVTPTGSGPVSPSTPCTP